MSKSKSLSRKLGRKNRSRRALIEQQAAKIHYLQRVNDALEESNSSLRVGQRNSIRIEAVQRHDYPRSGIVIEVTAIAPAGSPLSKKVVRRIDEEALRLRQAPDLFLMEQRQAAMRELLPSLEQWVRWHIEHKI